MNTTDWKTDLFRRITDRAFLLTVIVLIMAQVTGMTAEQLMSYMAVIAPFILGEKFKDAKAIQAKLESVKLPETMNAAGDVNVNQGASTPVPQLAPFSQSSEATILPPNYTGTVSGVHIGSVSSSGSVDGFPHSSEPTSAREDYERIPG